MKGACSPASCTTTSPCVSAGDQYGVDPGMALAAVTSAAEAAFGG